MRPAPAVGFGCAILFSVPFIGFGIGAVVVALSKLSAGDRPGAAALGLFGIVFGFVGVSLLVAVIAGRRARRGREQLEEGHPDEPWLWREDWAIGRVEDSHPSAAAGLWSFAVMWNLIAFPAGFFGVRDALTTGKPGGWGLLFPLVGIGLIGAATRASMRSGKFGGSRLDLVTKPASIGHGLGGVIRTPADVRPAGRNRGAALGVTLCTLLWGAAVTAVFMLDAPFVFKLVFLLFEALFIYATLRLWFRVVRVTADRERLSVAAGFGTPKKARTVPAAEVSDVALRIGMQSGNRVWYDLYAVRADGRKFEAGGGIRDKREAEWIAAQLRAALGQSSEQGRAS